MTINFTKTVEDFDCQNCQKKVVGTGYTNHCPVCLYSKHVDNSPGDRSSECCGIMKPSLERVNSNDYILKHSCQKCGHSKLNKSAKNDNIAEIIRLSAATSKAK